MVSADNLKPLVLSKKSRIVLSIAVVLLIVAEFMRTPINATLGYYLTGLIVKLLSYSIISLVVSAFIALIIGKFKTHTIIIFRWLMLLATSFDFIVAVFIIPGLRNYILLLLR